MFKVEKTNNSANVSRTIRFDEELFYILKNIAEQNKVSFNALVLQCCEYAISQMDYACTNSQEKYYVQSTAADEKDNAYLQSKK